MTNLLQNTDAQAISDPGAAIRAELSAVRADQAQASWLREGIDFLTQPYHHESSSLQKLEETAAQVDRQGNTAQSRESAAQAIKHMEAARQGELDSYRILSGAAKTAATFVPSKLGLFAAGTIYALDAVGATGSTGSDAFWGFTKGLLMRGAVSQITKGNDGPALMSLKLGLASRAIDTSLTPANYIDGKTGEASWGSIGSGLLRTGTTTLNPVALGTDIVTAGLAKGVLKIAPQQLAGNTFRAMTTMTFTRGYANGFADELQDQMHKGQFSPVRLAAYPLATALSTTLAAAPGNQSLYVRNWPVENGLNIRDADYRLVSISPSAVEAITRGGGRPVEATVKQIGEDLTAGQPEQMSISRAKVPTDWIAAALKSLKPDRLAAAPEQWRFVSRPKGDDNAPWQMVLNKGTTTIPALIKGSERYYQGKQTGPYLANLAEPAVKFVGSGSESGAFRLANGAVLKVSSVLSPDEKVSNWGKLPYDARALFGPVLFGRQPNRYNPAITSDAHSILLQEPVKTPGTEAQAAQLHADMSKQGITFWDYNYSLAGDQVSWAVDQIGVDATGKPVMIDYGARYGPVKSSTQIQTNSETK